MVAMYIVLGDVPGASFQSYRSNIVANISFIS